MIFYRIVILPIEYLIEVLYTILYRFFDSPGVGLIALSMVVSFMLLPLYLRADAMQDEERKKQDKMREWLDHIQKNFHGDERAMMRTEYYGIMHYHPLQSLRGLISLLLQIPFFIAAYHFLSHLEMLRGCSFGPIADLGAADGLLRLGSLRVNVLPILMTLINCISTMIYTKGFRLKEKLQPYVLSFLFLILLYDRPSGLVIYWTVNNLFSLGKNLVMLYAKKPKRVLVILLSALGLWYALYVLLHGKIAARLAMHDPETILYYALITALLLLPALFYVKKRGEPAGGVKKEDTAMDGDALLPAAAMTVLLGIFVPLSVIHASPLDFVNSYHYKNPLYFVYTSFCAAFGAFILWGFVICKMLSAHARSLYEKLLYLMFFVAVPTVLFFKPGNVDTIRSTLQWMANSPRYEKNIRMLNTLISAVVVFLVLLIFRLNKKILRTICAILLLALCLTSAIRFAETTKTLASRPDEERLQQEDRRFVMSRKGTNVVVIMLDRAIGLYVPFIFDQYPELKKKYEGFTFYPNTVSYGLRTKYGSPGLFGGYEYTPESMNARNTEKLADKHNQALRLMPLLFGEEGYHITACDLPYAGYSLLWDFSIFDEDKEKYDINAFHLQHSIEAGMTTEELWHLMERNFFFYSVYRSVPAMLQDEVYDEGEYLSADKKTGALTQTDFASSRAALEYFAYNTQFVEEGDELILFNNHTAHDPVELQLPDYVQQTGVDNSGFDTGVPRELDGIYMGIGNQYGGLDHYQVNVVALMTLGNWLDRLRQEGVYDNTRIILVSDHGNGVEQFEQFIFFDGDMDLQYVNCLLMEKDFDATGELKTDQSFMTNADTPSLAMKGIIQHPVNPFTGEDIDMYDKEEGANILYTKDHDLTDAYVFEPDWDIWYHVKDNIFEESNWTRIK